MKLKQFIKTFNIADPDWSGLPADFPDCDLTGLSTSQVGTFAAIKTMWQLSHADKPNTRSRVWNDPNGFQQLGVWQNAALLRILIRRFTSTLPLDKTLNQPLEYRLKTQMDDAARSVKRNIEEGWKRPTTAEYLNFLGYSEASLEELRGDIRDCKTDGFLLSRPGSTLADQGFNLRVFKGLSRRPLPTLPTLNKPLRNDNEPTRHNQPLPTLNKPLRNDNEPTRHNQPLPTLNKPVRPVVGEPTDPGHPYCQPLATLNPRTLTYEQFMELIHKTDYLLRRLVVSLERKAATDRKGYQIERARIRANTYKRKT